MKRISQTGLDLIKEEETLQLNAYDDGTGTMTIGYGHTGVGVERGSITEKQAELYLSQDLGEAERAVNKYVKVGLTQPQFDALVSFVFNVGASRFRNSTLLRKLNNGHYEDAAEEFERWVYGTVKGRKKIMGGLVRRRIKERNLFMQGRQ